MHQCLFLTWLVASLQVSRSASVDSINASGELCSVFLMLLERWKRYVVNIASFELSYNTSSQWGTGVERLFLLHFEPPDQQLSISLIFLANYKNVYNLVAAFKT